MKNLLFLSILSLSSVSWAAQEWKVVAETTVCDEKIKILGKNGEKYVIAERGEEKRKLFSKDGSAFNENSMQMTEFNSVGEPTYNFIHPSYVEANPPKLDVTFSGAKKRCKMQLSR